MPERDVQVGDVVRLAGGHRAIVREVQGTRVRVAAGRTDFGEWMTVYDVTVIYREKAMHGDF